MTYYAMIQNSSYNFLSINRTDLSIKFGDSDHQNYLVLDLLLLQWVDSIIGVTTFLTGLLGYFIMQKINNILTQHEKSLFGADHFSIFVAIHIFAWLTQFFGHGFYESKLLQLFNSVLGRAPALMSNLLFANIAPFFFCFEILNFLFGYKRNKRICIIFMLFWA